MSATIIRDRFYRKLTDPSYLQIYLRGKTINFQIQLIHTFAEGTPKIILAEVANI